VQQANVQATVLNVHQAINQARVENKDSEADVNEDGDREMLRLQPRITVAEYASVVRMMSELEPHLNIPQTASTDDLKAPLLRAFYHQTRIV
jgi:hypothetical protein